MIIDNTKDTSNKIMLADFDEVIVNIGPKWMKLIHENAHKLDKHLDILKYTNSLGHFDEVLFRDKYYFYDLFDKKSNLSDNQLNKLLTQFLDDETFYDDLELTPMGKGIKFATMQSTLSGVTILTHNVSAKMEASKDRFIKKHLPNAKVIHVPLNHKKSDYIKDLKYGTFVDDSLTNIIDLMNNTDCKGCQFMIPRLGYNKVTPELFELAKQKECEILLYDNVSNDIQAQWSTPSISMD